MSVNHIIIAAFGACIFGIFVCIFGVIMIIQNAEERGQLAFDAWNRIHPEMRLTREEFDALSNKRMLNLNK